MLIVAWFAQVAFRWTFASNPAKLVLYVVGQNQELAMNIQDLQT